MSQFDFRITRAIESRKSRRRRSSRRATSSHRIGSVLVVLAVVYLLAGGKFTSRVAIISPANGTPTLNARMAVSGTVADLQSGTVELLANTSAQTIPVSNGAFEALVSLDLGENTIVASTDGDVSEPIRIIRRLQPVVRIDTPSSQASATIKSEIEVAGVVENSEEQTVTLVVNGSAHQSPIREGTFSTRLPLVFGQNTITASVTEASSEPVKVARQSTIVITSPDDPFRTDHASVSVSGEVEDKSITTITLASKRVPPRRVEVRGGSFRSDFPLILGANEIRASVGDVVSNGVIVHREQPRVVITLDKPTTPLTTNARATVGGRIENSRGARLTLWSGVRPRSSSKDLTVLPGGRFAAAVTLDIGDNIIAASQGDARSNEVVITRVQPLKPPDIQPLKPPDIRPAGPPDVQPVGPPDVQPVGPPDIQPVGPPYIQPEKPTVKEPEKPTIKGPEKPIVEEPEKPTAKGRKKPRVKEPERPSVKEPVKPPVKEPVKPPFKEPERPSVKEPVKPPVKEPVKPPDKQPVKPPDKQTDKQPEKDPAPGQSDQCSKINCDCKKLGQSRFVVEDRAHALALDAKSSGLFLRISVRTDARDCESIERAMRRECRSNGGLTKDMACPESGSGPNAWPKPRGRKSASSTLPQKQGVKKS